eukprot:TRINITY_DN152_c0_g1_i2.p1 TRINITY_DN152_c0_g1~~TRINITY_DN152_c0_g1_i2.p1  ORF type:complete len:114 (+),score=15.33 TRINITY_DN152_c0_g1_i2:75-416(+)
MFAMRRAASQLSALPQLRAFAKTTAPCLGSHTGKVKNWLDKGFGFIEGSDGQEYFVHWSSIKSEGFKSLAQGEDVEFDLEEDPRKGGHKACNVTGPGGAPVKGAPRGEPRDSW